MGSSSESTSCANKYGRWRDLYDHEKCEHEKEQKEVKVIRWISVSMTNSFIYRWITLTRIFTIFNTPTEKFLKEKILHMIVLRLLLNVEYVEKLAFIL